MYLQSGKKSQKFVAVIIGYRMRESGSIWVQNIETLTGGVGDAFNIDHSFEIIQGASRHNANGHGRNLWQLAQDVARTFR